MSEDTPWAQHHCTRRHALKVFAAAGGAVLAGPLARTYALRPWDVDTDAIAIDSTSTPLAIAASARYSRKDRQDHPTLAFDRGNKALWTSWTEAIDGIERICLRSFSAEDHTWSERLTVSEKDQGADSFAHASACVCAGGRVLVVWPQYEGEGWRLLARAYDPGARSLGPVHVIGGALDAREKHLRPAIAVAGEQVLVAWEMNTGDGSPIAVMGRLLGNGGNPTQQPFVISRIDGRDSRRPAVAAAPDGSKFAVAFDRHEGAGTHNIYVRLVDAEFGKCETERAASQHPASDTAPSVAFSPDGQIVWVAWHTDRKGDAGWDIPRWYCLRGLRPADNSWHEPEGGIPPGDLEQRGTVQSFEFTRLAVSPGGAVCVLGRPSHNFCLQYFGSSGASPMYRLPAEGWGGRGRLLHGVFDGEGNLWVTRRDLNVNVIERVDGFAPDPGAPRLAAVADESNRAPAVVLAGLHERVTWPAKSRVKAYDAYNLYFGDIHGHSHQSDGTADPEDVVCRARDVFRDDFHALTDHDRFVGKRVSDAEWQQQKDMVEHYYDPRRFVTLFAQEWTTPRTTNRHGWGHYNVYTADGRVPLFDHGDERWRDLPDLLDAMRPYDAIAIPHHIGWTGIRWNVWDANLIPAIEVCSVHGAFEYEGNEPIRHRGGMKGCFIRDGLAKGLRFGFVGGSDQHGLIWHHGICRKRNAYRGGLTGVWAKELTRAGILDAIRQRRTFATSGGKLSIRFALDGNVMGSVIDLPVDHAPTMSMDVAVPPSEGRLGWIEIVRDGEVIHRFGGEAQRSRYTFKDETVARQRQQSSYYYLRTTLSTGEMAWTSPIWVNRS